MTEQADAMVHDFTVVDELDSGMGAPEEPSKSSQSGALCGMRGRDPNRKVSIADSDGSVYQLACAARARLAGRQAKRVNLRSASSSLKQMSCAVASTTTLNWGGLEWGTCIISPALMPSRSR